MIPEVARLDQVTAAGAQRWPNRIAFKCRDQSLRYDELHDKSRQLAQLLHDVGVRRGDRVGVFAGKTIELPVAVYGILAAGAAYVPLDPAAPAARIDSILDDCDISVLISEPNRLRVLQQLQYPVRTLVGVGDEVGLDAACVPWDTLAGIDSSVDAGAGVSDDLAYIIFTSGSTGQPKGIMHTHASGLAFARAAAETYALDCHDRLSNFPPLHFDQSVFDFFSGPLVGATTVLIPEDVMRFSTNLAQLIEAERLTIWYSVPMPLIRMLLDGALDSCDLSSVRWLLYGGEPFPPRYLRELMRHFDHATVSNVYGPAETNQCTHFEVSSAEEIPDDGVPIGPPWRWAHARVSDPDNPGGEELAEGELLVSSPTMMRGYWKGRHPECLVKLQDGEASRVYYRTGDFVRQRGDGALLFLGRRDRMVKSRGQRIELDEVEAALSALPEVAEAAAYAVPDERGETLIHAAVTAAQASVQPNQLLFSLRPVLPAAAIPSRIDVIDTFPRTSSGKIDRMALAHRASA